ncbi:MAG: hypothetical protein ACD_8C00067G0021 [uncultured bacterium]|nr:MAG: hypothetical protein ACD_8C00067G0021 [uncultured bacterium]
MHDEKITEKEIQSVTEILKKLEPGLLPLPIFLEFARLYVSCIIEVVPFYNDNGNIQVLLQEREAEDPIWGGKLHTAGTVVRANDKEGSFESAFDRILNKELQGISVKTEPVFIRPIFHQVARGRELALIFYVELATSEVSHLGKLYDVDKLPSEIVETQIEFIKDAVNNFAKTL